MTDDLIETTVKHIPVGNRIHFDNGLVGQRIRDEVYYSSVPADDMGIEDGGIPFIDVLRGVVFLVPGDNPASLIPDIPAVFTEAFEGMEDDIA